jgi:hypothetical protein
MCVELFSYHVSVQLPSHGPKFVNGFSGARYDMTRMLMSLQSVQDELVSLNLQLNMAEEKSCRLQRENQELIDRWMARVGKEADAMNNASQFS